MPATNALNDDGHAEDCNSAAGKIAKVRTLLRSDCAEIKRIATYPSTGLSPKASQSLG
jgi:hypothetical protein